MIGSIPPTSKGSKSEQNKTKLRHPKPCVS